MKLTRPVSLCALAAALTLTACGGDDASSATASAGGSATTAASAAGDVTVTIENCGTEQTFDAVPERAVTMNGHVTEILLALGLQGSMVGTAYVDTGVRPDLEAAYEAVPVLAEEYPTREQVLAAEPDIVVGGYASAFGDEAAGSRESLEAQGIATYLTTGYCPDRKGPQSLDLVEQDITDLGAIFGVADQATTVIAEVLEPVEQVAEAIDGVEPVTVFVYDSGTEQAFTAGGWENTTALIGLAGGRNVFEDVEDSFTEVSWEEVVARDPDVVLILDYVGSDPVADKEALLRSHPVTSTLRAVEEGNFVVVGLGEVVPGIRNGDTVETLAQAFHPDVVGTR